ncbi:hypothetical protein [Dyella sp. GSA-30]|uniref:hypothetical protein n=1 Tax=Dyella sp. GSA-30 TaxID=2994496 RepID=UPI002492361E|nr:hypothetical protein [Dyella sp. GSA-30]BDU22219.1 hypothetical protein DYGSA30_36760 [Dyella sp. GSA-30]
MNECIVFQHDSVPDRLADLGLTEKTLLEAISIAHGYAARCTENHPRIYPGLVMWAETLKALRDALRPLAWHRQDVGTYERVLNEAGTIGIAVASGTEGVGVAFLTPSNRSPKGRNTFKAVQINCTLDLFPDLPAVEHNHEKPDSETWVLLHYFDAKSGERRVELSRPRHIEKDGRINDWFERIILSSLKFDGDFDETASPDLPDVDFDVERKNL